MDFIGVGAKKQGFEQKNYEDDELVGGDVKYYFPGE